MGAAGPHVVAHIGDVDVQRVVAVGQAVHPHGVVEIARGFAVDGDDVAARGNRGGLPVRPRRSTFGIASRLLHDFWRKLMRQVVLADDDLDIDAEIVGVAQNLDHATYRPRSPSSGNSSTSTLTIMPSRSSTDSTFCGRDADAVHGRGRRRNLHAFGNLDPLVDALVVRHDVLAAAPDAELAHHGGMRALQHLDDLAIGAAAGLDAGDAHHHAVAVHGALRPARAAGRCRR